MSKGNNIDTCGRCLFYCICVTNTV